MSALFDRLFNSIRSRIIAGVVLIHALLMGLVVYDMLNRQQGFMETQLTHESINLASTLAANAPSWLISNDLNGLDELVGSLRSVKHLKLAMILDTEGEVKASSDPALVGLKLDDAPSTRLLQESRDGAPHTLWHDGTVDAVATVTSAGKPIGLTRVILDTAAVQSELNAIEQKGMIYTVFAILAGGIIAWLLVRTLVHHLERLSHAADNIAAGNLKVQLTIPSGNDEVARLTRDFSLMAQALDKDITERKQLEESLRQMNESLEQRIQGELSKSREKDHLLIQQARLAAMGEMARSIAHHWRQPLSALAGQLSNIKDEYTFHELTEERLDKDIAISMNLIDKMSATIDVFRDFFLTADNAEVFSLQRAIDSVTDLVRPDFSSHGITLTVEGNDSLRVKGFARELSQAILNILENAREVLMKHRPSDGTVQIRLWREGAAAKISVKDNGGGAAPDVLPRIFAPYYSTKEMGTGLGLYLTKTIVENMGGTIQAANVDDGLELVLSIPEAD